MCCQILWRRRRRLRNMEVAIPVGLADEAAKFKITCVATNLTSMLPLHLDQLRKLFKEGNLGDSMAKS
jgi:hypothetical protein